MESGVQTTAPYVSVVDDDTLVLRSIGRVLQSAGFAVRTFPSAQEFLAHRADAAEQCVLLDLAMPGLNGLEVQRELARSGDHGAVVFLSGCGDIAASVAAMKAGAVDFLTKPIERDKLIDAVRSAIRKGDAARAEREQRDAIEGRLATLTPREREVLGHVVAGRMNKQTAAALGTAEKTVKVHRARVMKKMGVGSLAELVLIAGRLV